MRPYTLILSIILSQLISFTLSAAPVAKEPKTTKTKVIISHARAFHGSPKYPADFRQFAYVNPMAPKGGLIRLSSLGTFDTFNAFANKGVAAAVGGYIYDSLMVRSKDEPLSLYGLIAKSIEYPQDNSWVRFHLNEKARFSDGRPITTVDVKHTMGLFMSEESTVFKSLLSGIEKVEVGSPQTITFYLQDPENRELPFRIAQLPILPAHAMSLEDFQKADMTIPIGSGPYRVQGYETGHHVTMEKVDEYWAEDLPVNRGRNNFQQVRIEYFRNSTIALQAFLAGSYDVRQENLAKNWKMGYQGPDLESGKIIKENYPRKSFQVQSFIFNTQNEIFKDRKVREAISQAYDARWTNHHLLYDNYSQPESLFAVSDYAQRGTPSKSELKLLEPFREIIPKEVFEKEWKGVITDGTGDIRRGIAYGHSLLKEAGWKKKGPWFTHPTTGKPLRFELLLYVPEQERIAIPFRQNLEQMGVDMQIKSIDLSQFLQRVRQRDYDMLLRTFVQPDAPGNEQKEYWHSDNAGREGSQNLASVSNPAVDAMVEHIIKAQEPDQLIAATRALDRILLWEHYTIPQLYMSYWRLAYRSHLEHPPAQPLYGPIDFSTWWEKQGQ